MEDTRDRIISHLQRQGRASIKELVRQLELAPASIRRHLDILQRDNFVSWSQVRRGAGRPSQLFFLTSIGQERLPRNYSLVANRILREIVSLSKQEIRDLTGHELADLILRKIAQRLAAEHKGRMSHKSLAGQVKELTQILNEEGCLAEWARTDGGFRILNYNCPYLLVAQDDPRFCVIHLDFIRALLPGEVIREQTLAVDGGKCAYLIRVKDGDTPG